MLKKALPLSFLLLTTACGGGFHVPDPCADPDPSNPLYVAAKEQGLCGGGETGGDPDVQDPDDSKPNGPHYDNGCFERIEEYDNWRDIHGYPMSGPLNEDGEWTNMATQEWPIYMVSLPGSVPLNQVGRPHYPGFPPELNCDDEQDLTNPKRSCMVGGFGLYTSGLVPSDPPRPPWIISPFEWIGHPEKFLRVSVAGDPCCGVISESDLNAEVPEFYKSDKAYAAFNNESCFGPVDINGTHEVWGYPRSNLGGLSEDLLIEQKKDEAANASICLNNGGEWDVQEAVATAPLRNNLIYVNFSAETFDDIIQSMTELFEEGVPFWGDIVEFMEQIGWYGLEDEMEDPPFFGYTGVCGYSCSVVPRYVEGVKTWWSGTECPSHLSCILPDFSLEEENTTITGFCEMETFYTPPPGIGDEGSVDIQSMEQSHGVPNNWIINLMTVDLEDLFNQMSFDSDPEGVRVYFNGPLAQSFASQMGLSDGDVVVYILGEHLKDTALSASDFKEMLETNILLGEWTKVQVNHVNHDNLVIRKHIKLLFNYF